MNKNELMVFESNEFGKVRVIKSRNEELFNLNDICISLGYTQIKNNIMYLRKERIEKVIKNIGISTFPHDGEEWIKEDAIYDFIFESGTDKSKKFRKWVTTEVIPSIRKHGAYMTEEVIEKTLTDPDFLIQLAMQLKEEKLKRLEAEKQIEEQKPLVTFAETCLKSNDSILIRELSKVANEEGINIGQNRLYKKLREWGLIMKGSTEPYQYAMERKWFVVEENNVNTPYGVKLTKTTKVTPKGQVYIIEKLKKEFIK